MFRSKFSYALIITLVFGFISCATTQAENTGDEMMKEEAPAEKKMHDDMSKDEMMEEWMKYATPGENHEKLQAMVGEWDFELTFWHTPDSEPQVSKGETKIKSIMDGRFLKQKATSEMHGQPFKGMGIIGYNNEKQHYESVWIDNMGTGMMKSTGRYDAEKNAIIESGTYTCPQTNGDKQFSAVTMFPDENTFTYEWFIYDENGESYRAMKIIHTKKAAAAE